jgi:hypothetical protein
MPNTNIQNLNYSDSQNQIVNKLNNNFDEMIELHGGVQGNVGPTGGDGAIGLAGKIGPTGLSGPRGTRWFVRSSDPGGSGSYSVEGDYWVEVSTSKIYIFTDSGWVYTGYNLSTQSDLFRDVSYTSVGGSSGVSITENQNSPSLYTFVIGDESPEDAPLINQNLSKFVISTDNSINDSPILEFSKSDIEDGTISDYTSHPVFNWSNTNSNNQDLSLEVPGGNFNIGASGGIEVYGSSISLESATGITFDGVYYIWATGGINFNFPSGNTTISSINFETGATFTSIYRAFSINPTLTSSTPSVYVDSGSTGAFKTERPTDTFDSISHSVYNVMLESNGPTGATESQFFIDTKGKIKTNKVDGGITYPTSTPGATSTNEGNLVYWYLLGRTSSPNSLGSNDFKPFPLTDGNIAVVNPYTVQNYLSSFCGIGIYSDSDYSWGTTGGLERGQSIRVSTYCSQDRPTSGVYTSTLRGFKYIGYGKNSSNINSVISLPFLSTSVDFIISRGATGSGTSVNYLAYGSSGGSGGSFYF